MPRRNRQVLLSSRNPLLSARELAEMLNVRTTHVRRLRATGRLPRPLRIGGSLRWKLAEIREWIGEFPSSIERTEDRP